MASILRSGKFVRYFASLTRSFVVNPLRESDGSFVQNAPCICSTLIHRYASTALKADQNLEKSLKRLDQDVRRTGRISRRDIEEILDEIRQQRSATSSQSLLVIRCCGNLVPEELPEVRTALVQEIWKTLNTLNVPMDISHYNALLRVYLENEHQFSPTDFLANLESKGIEPNRVTYQRLIGRYCQQGDIEGATRILEFMREKQHPVNENVFNALIVGHSQANDMQSAVEILSVMKQAGLEPSADTYTTLLCCYARHGDMEAINRVLEECEKNEIFLLDKDFLDIIYSLTVNGHGDKVDGIITRIRKAAGYNQDAVNLILRLTNRGYEDVAYKVLKTMPRATRADGSLTDTGNFFIRQMVKANRPVDKIVEICKDLERENLNTKALLVATEASLTQGLLRSAFPLLKELKNSGGSVRQHFFWPLMCSSNPNEILDVVRKMSEEFDITANNETVRDYVIPNLKEQNMEKVITSLCGVGIPITNASTAAVYNSLQGGKLKEAANIASTYKAYYSPGLFRKPLVVALSKTNDYDSYIKFVRHLYENLPRLANIQQTQLEEDEGGESPNESLSNQSEVLGQIVYDAVNYFKRNRVEVVEKILKGLVEQGLSISNSQAERILDRLGSEMTTQISELLGKLAAGDLEPIAIERSSRGSRVPISELPVENIEKIIQNAEAKNENTNALKRTLLSACFKSKNLEKAEEVVNRLEKEEFVFTSGIYAQLIDLYCFYEKLDATLQLYEKVKAKEPDFSLDLFKTVKVANLMIKLNQIDEAVKFLESNKKEELKLEKPFDYKSTCWRMLNFLAEAGNAAGLQRVFQTLEKCNYIDVSNILLGPLVKVHLINNDLKKAVDTFEEICTKYQATPWKNELACRLIQAEDATNLQRLTDLSTNIHGEVNSLYDLVFAFVDCGRIRQARKILETPGLRNRPQRINSACERYMQEGMVQSLEGLIEATKDLNHIDRADIFHSLLLTYCKEDQPEKALGLWTKMQEENIAPSDMFLLKLGEYLKSKNLEVPFVMPSQEAVTGLSSVKKETTTKHQQQQQQKETTTIADNEPKRVFRAALRSGDVDKAITAKRKLTEQGNLSVLDESILIEALVKADRITEATKCISEMLDKSVYPIPRVFKFFLNKLAVSGDVATIESLGERVSADLKKILSFDNRLCHAYTVAGKVDPYIAKLKQDAEKAQSDEEIKEAVTKFPRGGIFSILEQRSDLIKQFEEIAEIYAIRGHLGPINVIWINHFIAGNEENANKIWDKYLSAAPRLMFQKILQAAREKQDEQLTKKLIEKLKTAKISEGALGNAYSALFDVLTGKEKFDEALEVLKVAVNDVCLENFNKTALRKIQSGLDASGKDFPYKIPERTARNDDTSSSSTSSSSSDDEGGPQRRHGLNVPKQKAASQ